jgi:PAB-dependent poly(A)-specific ribonuclease subunit 2
MISILGQCRHSNRATVLTLPSFYNRTAYSGLEIHISNSYANPLLQLMHFTPLIRNLALQHAATACVNDLCLLCELGFLFDMLEKAEGSICQATNLLKTLSNQPQGRPPASVCSTDYLLRVAGPLALLEEDSPGSSLTSMLQALNRFFTEKIAQDFRSMPPYATTFDQVRATSLFPYLC